MTISVVVITKNEERNIAACLASVQWADEVIVVDACSDDQTVARAAVHTPKVFVRPWSGFGPQKNFAIEQAHGEWILIIDADERVTEGLAETIRGLGRQAPEARVSGYRIPRKNYFYGRWMQYGGMFPDRQMRFFRKAMGRYDDTLLHEQLLLRGDVEDLCGVYLEHHSVSTIQQHVRKMMHYTSLSAREKLKTIGRVTCLQLLGHHVGILFKALILRRGWKDGVHGCIAAMFAGFHAFLKYAKAYERLKTVPSGAVGTHVADRI